MNNLDKQMYGAFGSMVLMIIIYTSLIIHNIKNPRVFIKRNKSKKHALLRTLLEQKRMEDNETNGSN